jgi:HEPN domain-containing protein
MGRSYMKEVTEEWLKAAADDLRVIDKIASDEYLTHMVAFHSQQCIEKSLKAVIEEYEIGSVRIHNLERLFEIVSEHQKLDIDPVLVAMLDKLYIDARYPGDLGLLPTGKPTLGHAARFHAFAKSVHEIILAHLKLSK